MTIHDLRNLVLKPRLEFLFESLLVFSVTDSLPESAAAGCWSWRFRPQGAAPVGGSEKRSRSFLAMPRLPFSTADEPCDKYANDFELTF